MGDRSPKELLSRSAIASWASLLLSTMSGLCAVVGWLSLVTTYVILSQFSNPPNLLPRAVVIAAFIGIVAGVVGVFGGFKKTAALSLVANILLCCVVFAGAFLTFFSPFALPFVEHWQIANQSGQNLSVRPVGYWLPGGFSMSAPLCRKLDGWMVIPVLRRYLDVPADVEVSFDYFMDDFAVTHLLVTTEDGKEYIYGVASRAGTEVTIPAVQELRPFTEEVRDELSRHKR